MGLFTSILSFFSVSSSDDRVPDSYDLQNMRDLTCIPSMLTRCIFIAKNELVIPQDSQAVTKNDIFYCNSTSHCHQINDAIITEKCAIYTRIMQDIDFEALVARPWLENLKLIDDPINDDAGIRFVYSKIDWLLNLMRSSTSKSCDGT